MSKISVVFFLRPQSQKQGGGDLQHAMATLQALKAAGHPVKTAEKPKAEAGKQSVWHAFNMGKPQWILPLLGPQKPPLVVSTVYVDYTATETRQNGLRKVILNHLGVDALEYLKNLARFLKKQEPWPGWRYLLLGHRWAVQEVLRRAQCLVTASQAEYELLRERYGIENKHLCLPLGHEHFPQAKPAPRRQGVLCAARIEPLKNQLNLIKACQQLKLPLVLAGKASRNHAAYYQACRAAADDSVQFVGELDPAPLAEAMARCAVHALPSFYESTGLSTLEALKNGAPVVVGNHPITQELFGSQAYFCEPAEVESIKAALQKALQAAEESKTNAAASPLAPQFSWVRAAEKLSDLYQDLCRTANE